MPLRASWLLVVAASFISACGSLVSQTPQGVEVAVASGTYTEINVNELLSLLDSDRYILVNVHVPFEGDIPGTDLSIPFDAIEDNLSLIPDERSRIILYCKGEGMSTVAAETLVQLGYRNIYKLDGGIIAWQEAGQSLVK